VEFQARTCPTWDSGGIPGRDVPRGTEGGVSGPGLVPRGTINARRRSFGAAIVPRGTARFILGFGNYMKSASWDLAPGRPEDRAMIPKQTGVAPSA
jgi:hypothetical protein